MLLSGPELAFAMGVVFLSSTVAGLVGFGMGMMLSPLLLLVLEPQPVVLAVNSLSFVGLAMIGVKGRREVSSGVGKAAGYCRAGRSPRGSFGVGKPGSGVVEDTHWCSDSRFGSTEPIAEKKNPDT